MRRSVAIGALLLTTLFAGCANSPNGTDDAEPEPEAFSDVQVTDTTGAIRGIVVSEAIVPIADVLVRLVDGRNQTTDEEGAFVFNGLEPGDYFMVASKFGYQSVQQAATVVAGEKEPPITKIQLLADSTQLAYATTEIWEGFVACAGTVGVAGGYAGGHICTEDQGSRFIKEFPFADGKFPTYVQDEMHWDNTQPLGDQLSPGYYRSGLTDWKTVSGSGPLLLNATAEEIHEEEEARDSNMTALVIRVFPGHETGLTLTYNQAFTIYHSVFYGVTPRPGWLFTVDGACEPVSKCV